MAAMFRAPVLWTCISVALGLMSPACSAVSKVDYSECTETATCRDAFGIGWVCGDAGLCQEVEVHERCRRTWPEDLFKNPDKYRDSIILGSLFDHTREGGDLVLVNSASLAIEQANMTGLSEGRDYAIVHCGYQADADIDDLAPDAAVVETAKFLVDTYNTPVIIGPGTSSLAEAAFKELQKPERKQTTLLISPSATSPSLTTIDATDDDEPGLFWRTAPPDSLLGEVLADKMKVPDEELGSETITSAAVIFVNDTYGLGLKNELDKNYDGMLLPFPYGDPSEIGSLVARAKVELGGEAAPNIGVVFIGSTVEDVVDFINAANINANKAFYSGIGIYLGDAGKNDDVVSQTQNAADTIHPRIRGVFPGAVDVTDEAYGNFETGYVVTFNGETPTAASYSAQTFDATWLAIFGTAWAEFQRDGKLTGQDIAYGLREISSGPQIVIGALSWNEIKSEFKDGNSINIVGASGSLDYDETEETKAPVEYWKIGANGSFEIVEIVEPDE